MYVGSSQSAFYLNPAMRAHLVWSDKVQDQNGIKQPIWDVAFHPTSKQLIVTAGTEILVYSIDGELIQSLKSHKDAVYCLDISFDGKRFASGGADKQVIIWNGETLEGIVKYSHSDIIQSLAYNPVTGQVLSCTPSDFGLWSAEQKNVIKTKMQSKILTSAWSSDGQSFAIGMYSGMVSIRNRSGIETAKIDRGKSPVWSLSWNPNPDKEVDLIAVTDWSQKLAFYTPAGKQIGKDRDLGMDPCAVSFSTESDFVVVGGSDRKATIWTTEGFKIGAICEREHWIWCCKVKPKDNFVAIGCQDGSISLHQIVFDTVHGLYNDRYAFRENMTGVVIQHLVTDQKARIKCRDHVKKISVYKDRLAVQLPDRVIIYELFHDDVTDMHYRIRAKIQKRLDCNLLVVTSLHVILCIENKLQMFNFMGEKEREWNLEALVRYIKVSGGPPGREGLLVGLKNGHILQVFVDNHFPILLIKQTTAIRCLDISMHRKKIAVVDDQNTCLVYDIATKEQLYQEPNASSVSWNMDMEDVLCFAGNGLLNVKSGLFPAIQQPMKGFVVGFKGSRVFSLQNRNMTILDVSYTVSLERHIEKGDFDEGYKVACLSVPQSDWRCLAMKSLTGLSLEISRKSYMRLGELKFIDLIQGFENSKRDSKQDVFLHLGDISAILGKFQEQAGQSQRAINMYTELNMWDQATQIAKEGDAGSASSIDILRKKAKMLYDRNDIMAAASAFIEIGEYMQAIDIFGPNGRLDNLIDVARRLNKNDMKGLARCIYFFRIQNHHAYAAEVLLKMGDIQHLLDLHIELQHWEEAFKLAESYPQYIKQIYLPYANWLAMNDKFVEAQLNYQKAGRLDEAFRVLEQLSQNSIIEKRYEDGAYYFWTLAMQHCDILPDKASLEDLDASQRKTLQSFYTYYELSEIYYAYHSIQRYMDEPFTSHVSEALFNMSLFVLNYLNRKPAPKGVSRVYVLFALAKLARILGAYKTARYAYEKLQSCVIPEEWIDLVELGTLTIRSKPIDDRKDLMSICYGCGTIHPLTLGTGDMDFTCTYCLEPFLHSFYSFETLPIIRFAMDDGISAEKAEKLISIPSLLSDTGKKLKQSSNILKENGNIDTPLEGGMAGATTIGPQLTDDDPFNRALLSLERKGTARYVPVILDRAQVVALDKYLVYVRCWGKNCIPKQYYKQVLGNNGESVGIKLCSSCQHFFLDDEWYAFSIHLNIGAIKPCKKKRAHFADSQSKADNAMEV